MVISTVPRSVYEEELVKGLTAAYVLMVSVFWYTQHQEVCKPLQIQQHDLSAHQQGRLFKVYEHTLYLTCTYTDP